MGGCGWRWNMMELNGTDFGSSTMFQRYDMVWYATCVFLFWYIFGNTRKYVEIDRLWLMDFDRDGHVTFARELWQPDRVNFGHFYGVDFGKFWPANSHKFPWFAGKSPHLFAGRACLGNHLRASSSSQLFLRDLKLRNYQHPHNWLMDIHDIRDIHVYSCIFMWFLCRKTMFDGKKLLAFLSDFHQTTRTPSRWWSFWTRTTTRTTASATLTPLGTECHGMTGQFANL